VLGRVANYCANAAAVYVGCAPQDAGENGPTCIGPREVRAFEANAFGVYDMLGNVSEWIWDGYSELPPNDSPRIVRDFVVNPSAEGPWSERGGSWADNPRGLRVADRTRVETPTASPRRGFRLVRSL
jgi:formylglycine-generating enzyme required for sulfatase activity